MTALQFERLEKLTDHAEIGALSVDRFTFASFRLGRDCDTLGCFAGELPLLFPDEWQLIDLGGEFFIPRLKGSDHGTVADLASFFGLKIQEVDRLFYPIEDDRSGSTLHAHSSRATVAEQMRAFLNDKRAQLK